MTTLNAGDELSTSMLLLAEMAHRIGNEYTLAMTSLSLAALRANNSEAKDALDDACRMLKSYADTHRALRPPFQTEAINLAEYLCELCRSLARSRLADRGVTIGLVAYPVALAPERAWRVALIISELVVNSLRHAFNGHCGRIVVEIDRRGNTIECRVADDGCSVMPAAPGYGSAILKALASQLGGHIEREFDSRGGRACLTFPHSSSEPDAESHEHWARVPTLFFAGVSERWVSNV
jgi:two-component sensor histidine kinase